MSCLRSAASVRPSDTALTHSMTCGCFMCLVIDISSCGGHPRSQARSALIPLCFAHVRMRRRCLYAPARSRTSIVSSYSSAP
ncbi:hypothetical protein OH77DRAFT_321772 [Trametes cingulata]|nr:hypothetical protein OH77DRAFT_321772 [Trametes cingulata]